jgi:hypothetical protein
MAFATLNATVVATLVYLGLLFWAKAALQLFSLSRR